MKTNRSDVKRDNRPIKCPNCSIYGYSTTTLRKGDFFIYRCNNENFYGLCHGRIRPLAGKEWVILTQQLSSNLQYSYERWVNPADVIEIVPAEVVNKNLLAMFAEQENLIV